MFCNHRLTPSRPTQRLSRLVLLSSSMVGAICRRGGVAATTCSRLRCRLSNLDTKIAQRQRHQIERRKALHYSPRQRPHDMERHGQQARPQRGEKLDHEANLDTSQAKSGRARPENSIQILARAPSAMTPGDPAFRRQHLQLDDHYDGDERSSKNCAEHGCKSPRKPDCRLHFTRVRNKAGYAYK